jgi:hypothetical protein
MTSWMNHGAALQASPGRRAAAMTSWMNHGAALQASPDGERRP